MKRISRVALAVIKRRNAAFTRLDLLMTIALVVVIVALIATGGVFLGRARARAFRLPCINNLKQCELAFGVWSEDHNGKFPMEISTNQGGTRERLSGGDVFRHFQVMSNELSTAKVLTCPAADIRRSATNFGGDFDNTKISFFIGEDGSKDHPQAWLCGDRNITNGLLPVRGHLTLTTGQPVGWTREMHDRCGNVTRGNGVEQISNRELSEMMNGPWGWTNRIILPD